MRKRLAHSRALAFIFSLLSLACSSEPSVDGLDTLVQEVGDADLAREAEGREQSEVGISEESPRDVLAPEREEDVMLGPLEEVQEMADAPPQGPEEPTSAEPFSIALCADAEPSFAGAGAATTSASARFAFLDTGRAAMTGSIADVDGDGRSDLLVGRELFMNCGDSGFASLTLPDIDTPELSSSAIMDVDADGRLDLVYGDVDGRVWTLIQGDDGVFTLEGETSVSPGAMIVQLSTFPDKDADGRLDYLYASTRAFPPTGFIFGATSIPSQAYADNEAANVLFSLGPSGEASVVDLPPDIADCGRSPAFASQMATRHHLGLADTLYISGTWSADCAYPLSESAGTPIEPIYMPSGTKSYTKMNWSMGVDHTYVDEGVLFGVTDVGVTMTGRPRVNLWLLDANNELRALEGQEANVPPSPPAKIGWGLHFADFNLDGHTDLLFGYAQPGVIGRLDDAGEPVINWPPSPSAPGGVELFEGDASGTMVEVQGAEPPEHAGRSSFGLIVGDFYGAEGKGDGCMDVMVTPLFLPRCIPGTPECDAEEEIPIAMAFNNSVGLLRNRCADDGPKPFVGVRAPVHASGAVARLTLSGGQVIHRPIRASSGTTGTSETSVVFGLPQGSVVEALDVLHPSGELVSLMPSEEGYSGWLSL